MIFDLSALRTVDVLEDDGLAGDDDDADGPTRGLPDWVIPKVRLASMKINEASKKKCKDKG